jgi:NAD(P)-dependent dehydrogenase (short-subunit alcohol dehydrogenase family)
MQIKGAVALVTGAAKGIGHSFCLALLENGAASVRMSHHVIIYNPR